MNASALLEKLAAFVPTPVVQAIYKHGFTPGEPMGQRLEAAVLFADISGFTALGELLSQAGVTGAEELTRLINTYFTRIIETIERYQGQVVKFSGDALTVIYTTDDIDLTSATHRASQCALEIQDVLEHIEVPETSQGPAPALSMKIGIGTGKILACSVGGELRRWEYVVAGDPLVQVATAQNKAHPKEVILSPQAWALTARFFVGKEDRSGFVRLVRSYDPLPLPVPIRFRWDTLNDADIPKAEDALKRYIPGAINARLDNQAEWLAELRRMNVLFIGLGGLDYEADDAVERLQALVQGVQKTIYEFEGALNKVAVDDKGTVLLILFGAPPFTHEDDAQRAVACALRLQEVAQQQGLRMSIGITEGSIFAGPVGAPTRQEYTVIGDQVNLAARLMQHGRRGTIIISQQVRDRVSNRFNVEDLGRIPIKGKSQALFAYQVLGEEGAQLQFLTRYFSKEDPLIGRKAELEQIRRMASRTKNGELQVLLIEGELGLGKSRLAAEMVREWMNDSGAAYGSTCSSYSHQMPYQCWQRIFSAMYGLTPDLPTERQLARLAGAVANLEDPADQPGYWADRLPLLQEIMGINIPETAFTESISGELRRDNTFVLIEMLLRQQAMNQPLLILLEDIHWADELSLALAAHLVQTLSDSPVFLVLAHRPMATLVPSLITIRQQSQTELIYLEPLSGQDSLTMANGILGGKPLPEGAIALLLNRAQGNPFFIQEIAQTIIGLLDQPTDQSNRISEALDLPGTVQDAILTRIDKLPDQEKLTLKIASVIGASFERTLLSAVHPIETVNNVLFSQLQDLETEKLIRLEAPDPKWEYAFRNVITQEVVYEGLLLAQRRQLHTDIGQVLEKLVPEEIERLAFHYSRSNDFQKGMYYLHLATERARREYANQAAVSYLDEMLNLIANPPIEEQSNEPSSPPPNVTNQTNGYLQTYQTGLYSTTYWDFLLERSQLYNLLGQREEEAEDLGTLGVLAEALQDTRRRALAARQWSQYYEAAGDYASGLETVERAVQLAEETEDQQFVGEIYSSWGKMLFLSGDYTLASTQLQHATEIAQDYHDEVAQADSLYNQGIIHFFQAHYDEALTYFQQAVDLWKKLNDQVNLGKGLRELGRSYFQLGQLMAAQEHLERALTLMRKIHDSVSAAITQNYAGQVETRLGNYLIAEALFTSAQKVHQETENQSAAAESKAYLGFLYSRQGNHERAITTLEEALETIRELEDTWALSTALTYYGWALIEAGDPHSAQLFLQEVLQIERDVKPGIDEAKIMEVLVLLGRTALARNDLSLASTCSRHALAHLNTHGTKGFEYPVRVYLTVYEMLMALDKEAQAKDILCEVSAFINTQAEQITDPGLRERFLTRVPEIRDVRSLIDEV